eukprot:5669460-Amphidinium_carterae.1
MAAQATVPEQNGYVASRHHRLWQRISSGHALEPPAPDRPSCDESCRMKNVAKRHCVSNFQLA